MFRNTFYSALLLVTWPGLSRADNCDPTSFKGDLISIHEQWAQLLYQQTLNQSQQGATQTGGDVSLFDVVDLSGNTKTQYLNQLSSMLNLNIKQEDKSFLFASAFTPNGVQAYTACLENTTKNIFITPTALSEGDPDFSINVRLRPYPVDSLISVTVTVTAGGTITSAPTAGWTPSANKLSLHGRMAAGSDVQIGIKRDVTARFELEAVAGDHHTASDQMSLPAVPTTVLIQEPRYSNVFTSACSDCFSPSVRSGYLSISLLNDEVIVPRSEQIIACQAGSSPGMTPGQTEPVFVTPGSQQPFFAALNKDAYSNQYRPHNIDIPVSVGSSTHGFVWRGSAVLEVQVVVPVKVGETSSNRPHDKPTLQCTL
jgi:hypothetical protein